MSTNLEIKHGSNKFFIGEDAENPVAYMSYVNAGSKQIIVDSTYVPENMNSQGIGKLLLEELVNWARGENKKIMATCPYVIYQMKKNENYHDIYLNY